jgi:hypothetical protein
MCRPFGPHFPSAHYLGLTAGPSHCRTFGADATIRQTFHGRNPVPPLEPLFLRLCARLGIVCGGPKTSEVVCQSSSFAHKYGSCAAPLALNPLSIRNPGLTAGAIHCRAFGALAWGCRAEARRRPEGPAVARPGRQAGIRGGSQSERRRRGTIAMDASCVDYPKEMCVESRPSRRRLLPRSKAPFGSSFSALCRRRIW